MDVSIYSVKANSQVGNVRVFIMTTQKGQSHTRYSAWDPKNLCNLTENLAGGLGSRTEHGYVSVFDNTPEKLILKPSFP